MSKTYVTTAVFWRHGLEVAAGTELTLTDKEAKYLKHALNEKGAEKPAPTKAAAPVQDAVEAPIADEAQPTLPGAVVEEQPHKRRHK